MKTETTTDRAPRFRRIDAHRPPLPPITDINQAIKTWAVAYHEGDFFLRGPAFEAGAWAILVLFWATIIRVALGGL